MRNPNSKNLKEIEVFIIPTAVQLIECKKIFRIKKFKATVQRTIKLDMSNANDLIYQGHENSSSKEILVIKK